LRGGWGNSTPFQRRNFLRIGKGELFLGWELTQRFISWVAWEVEVWFFFKVGMWDFLIFQGIFFLGMEKFQHKNLVERTNNILFKTKHLIHLTNNNIYFF
jgi:hypothetical protein